MKKKMADLVDNKEDVVRNILTFAGYRTGSTNEKNFHDKKFRNVVHFIACKYNGSYLFSPPDLAVCKNYPYLQSERIRIQDSRITKLLGKPPYEHGNSGYAKIYAAYMDYCDVHDCNRNEKTRDKYERERHFWFIDADILHSQSSAHNAHHSTGNADSLLQDIEDIKKEITEETTRKALIEARIGQGQFRDEVMTQWGYACAFTGCKTPGALRASHIKPWKDCSNDERLDRANGLILVANLDALFDRYLISFEDGGQMRVSAQLSKEEQKLLGVRAGCLRKELNEKQCSYLAHHHENFNRREKAARKGKKGSDPFFSDPFFSLSL